MDPEQVRRLRAAWLIALIVVTGVALVAYGFLAAVMTAVAFVGASMTAFVAFVLWLLLGEESVAFRLLMIALFLVGLAVELRGIVAVFEMIRSS
jgi:hypothetical protein